MKTSRLSAALIAVLMVLGGCDDSEDGATESSASESSQVGDKAAEDAGDSGRAGDADDSDAGEDKDSDDEYPDAEEADTDGDGEISEDELIDAIGDDEMPDDVTECLVDGALEVMSAEEFLEANNSQGIPPEIVPVMRECFAANPEMIDKLAAEFDGMSPEQAQCLAEALIADEDTFAAMFAAGSSQDPDALSVLTELMSDCGVDTSSMPGN